MQTDFEIHVERILGTDYGWRVIVRSKNGRDVFRSHSSFPGRDKALQMAQAVFGDRWPITTPEKP